MKKRKLSKRLLSYILCLVMVISLVPMNAITVQAEGVSNTTFEYGDYKILMLSGYIDEGDGNFSCQVCGEPVFENYNPKSDYADLFSIFGVGTYKCMDCGDGIHFGITMKTPLPNASPCPHCCKGKVCSKHANTHSYERYDIQSVCNHPCQIYSDNEEICHYHSSERLDITCEYCRGTGIDPYFTHDHHLVYVHKVDRDGINFHVSKCDYPRCDKGGVLPNSGYSCDTDGPDGACSYCGFKAEAPAHTHTKGTYHEPVAATCTNPGVVGYWDCSCGEKLDADGNVLASTEVAATGNHNFSVSVNETTHKCADCDATGNHVFSNDSDTTCDVCGYVRTVTEEEHTSDEIIYEVDINGIHHLKYDENTETYICKDEGCEKAFEPGYYDNDGLVEDTKDTVYALLGNITETDIGFYDYESLEIVDLGSLTSYGSDFDFSTCSNLTYLNLGNLTSYDYDFNLDYLPNLTYFILGSLTSYDYDFHFTSFPNLTYVDLGSLTSYERNFDFDNCPKLTNVKLGNLMNCENLSVTDCSGLINVDLGSLQNIHNIGFSNCKSLQTVNLQNLIDLDLIIFFGCESLESVKVHEGDPCYIRQDVEEDVLSYAPHTFIIDSENSSQHICSVCDAAGDHDFDEDTVFTKVDGNTHQWTCSSCGGVASGKHDFSQNGTCACGLIQIEFEIIDDDEKTVRVTGLNKDFDMTHDLFIPSTVEVNGEDYSVTEIGEQAFWECNIIGEVVIPDSVITIGDYAFSGCGNIERISIPCTIDPYKIYWGIDCDKISNRNHDFSNGALKCNLCGKCKALSEKGRHDFNDEFECTNCGQVDQFGVYFSQYKDLITVENDEDNPWDMDYQYIVPGNVDSYAYSSMTITAKKRVKISFSYSFDKAPHGEDMMVIKRTTKEGDYEENERYPSNYNGEYPYDSDNRDPLILYPGEALQIDYRFGSEYKDEGIKLGEFKINEITYVEIKGMSLELDPVYGEYIGVNLYIDASDNASLYFDDMPVTPDGKEVKLVIDDNTGINKIQYRCAVKEFADIHKLVACDGDGNTIALSIDQYTDVEEFTYSGMTYCHAVLAGGTEYSDELKDVCNALIEFNEQARNYFEYNNDGLNVGSVTADIPTTGYEASMTGKLPEGCLYIGSSLVLEEQLVLRHYFVGNIGSEVISCVDTTNNKAVEITTGNTADDRITYVDIAAPYSQIADMYTVLIREGETAYTLTYGVLTYCNKAYELGQNSELVNTCNAMYNYSVAVNAYFSIGQ